MRLQARTRRPRQPCLDEGGPRCCDPDHTFAEALLRMAAEHYLMRHRPKATVGLTCPCAGHRAGGGIPRKDTLPKRVRGSLRPIVLSAPGSAPWCYPEGPKRGLSCRA